MSGVISIRSLQGRNECRSLSLMFAVAVNGTRTTLGGALSSLTALKKFVISSLTQWIVEARCLSRIVALDGVAKPRGVVCGRHLPTDKVARLQCFTFSKIPRLRTTRSCIALG